MKTLLKIFSFSFSCFRIGFQDSFFHVHIESNFHSWLYITLQNQIHLHIMEDMDETQIVLCPNVQLSSSFGFVSVSIDYSDLKSLRMAMEFPVLWSLDIECKSRISLKIKKSALLNPEDVLKRHPNFQDRNRGFGYWITLAEAFLGKRLNVTDNNDIVELVNFVKTTLPELLDAEVFNNVQDIQFMICWNR